jgi:hypothetical protein
VNRGAYGILFVRHVTQRNENTVYIRFRLQMAASQKSPGRSLASCGGSKGKSGRFFEKQLDLMARSVDERFATVKSNISNRDEW